VLLKLKKEQSIKLKITIVLIWIAVISMLLSVIYDIYLVYIDEYELDTFASYPVYMVYMAYIFYIGNILIGLLFKSKIARGFVLLFSYVPLFIKIMSLLIYGAARGEITDIYLLLTIYLLSHDEILKIYKVKYLKKEIIVYFVLSVLILIRPCLV